MVSGPVGSPGVTVGAVPEWPPRAGTTPRASASLAACPARIAADIAIAPDRLTAGPDRMPPCQTSPVVEVTVVSNSLPCTTALVLTVPAGAGPSNGPVCPIEAPQKPAETAAASSDEVALLLTFDE